MNIRPAERLHVDLLVGHRPHHVRARNEHVARAPYHEDEVHERGGVDGAAGAGAEDDRDLWHDPRREGVSEEDLRVAGERNDALLDPGAARVVQSDDGGAVLEGEVLDLDDLLGVALREGAPEDRRILGVDEDEAAEDGSVTGDDAVTEDPAAVGPEVRRAMRHEAVEFDEGVVVEEEPEALPRRELAPGPVRRHALFATAEAALGPEPLELLQPVLHPVASPARRGAKGRVSHAAGDTGVGSLRVQEDGGAILNPDRNEGATDPSVRHRDETGRAGMPHDLLERLGRGCGIAPGRACGAQKEPGGVVTERGRRRSKTPLEVLLVGLDEALPTRSVCPSNRPARDPRTRPRCFVPARSGAHPPTSRTGFRRS